MTYKLNNITANINIVFAHLSFLLLHILEKPKFYFISGRQKTMIDGVAKQTQPRNKVFLPDQGKSDGKNVDIKLE